MLIGEWYFWIERYCWSDVAWWINDEYEIDDDLSFTKLTYSV